MNYVKRIKQNPENQKDKTEIIRPKLVIPGAAKNLFPFLVDKVQAEKRD
jgi:hypothetical protein